MTPKFSIIIVDYEGSVDRPLVNRALSSLINQSFQDFEILLFHDGPKTVSYAEEIDTNYLSQVTKCIVTEKRYNDYGHSLRDLGIRSAKGEYIVHLNADNFFYPFAFAAMDRTINLQMPPVYGQNGQLLNGADIIIFPIVMRGMIYHHHRYYRDRNALDTMSVVFSGIPPRPGNIDCMQLVMKRQLWLDEGGWSNKSEQSDGALYHQFCRKYGIRTVDKVLGEHF